MKLICFALGVAMAAQPVFAEDRLTQREIDAKSTAITAGAIAEIAKQCGMSIEKIQKMPERLMQVSDRKWGVAPGKILFDYIFGFNKLMDEKASLDRSTCPQRKKEFDVLYKELLS